MRPPLLMMKIVGVGKEVGVLGRGRSSKVAAESPPGLGHLHEVIDLGDADRELISTVGVGILFSVCAYELKLSYQLVEKGDSTPQRPCLYFQFPFAIKFLGSSISISSVEG